MYVSTYIVGNYIRDGALSITNKLEDRQLICKSDNWIDLLQMEQKIILLTDSIIRQIAEDKNGQAQSGLINDWQELTTKYLKSRNYIIPRIEERIEKKISTIPTEKDEQDLTIF